MIHARALFATLALALAACGSRAHLDERHGQATLAWKVRQRVEAQAATGKPAGLDSEEAAIIHANYRDSLTCEKAAAETSPVIMLETSGGGRGQGAARR